MYWCSSAESEKLVKSVEDSFEKIRRIGPSPLNIGEEEAEVEMKELLTTPLE